VTEQAVDGGKKQNKEIEYVRILPALVVDLVDIAIALVVGVFGLDIEYLGLIEEFEVETEHFLVLRVLGVVSLGRSHSRKFCRVVLVRRVPEFYTSVEFGVVVSVC
jgi:hypothetical protein